jgi:hypothetical protein
MQRLRDLLYKVIIYWMFGATRCEKEQRIKEVSGYDDDNCCLFTGDHIVTWPKKQKKTV